MLAVTKIAIFVTKAALLRNQLLSLPEPIKKEIKKPFYASTNKTCRPTRPFKLEEVAENPPQQLMASTLPDTLNSVIQGTGSNLDCPLSFSR